MELKELRQKTQPELQKLLAQRREDFREINFKISQRQYKNYQERGTVKKNIAQILTVMKEKELLEETTKESK
ncbi:50S ribosomal protein L29 [Patescibacteria group bacterium]|nr:50S ribosomal protein L29 [Patescibacteria group bacterium]